MSKRTGGYVNKLVVTCLRSGVSRGFRVLQKPERAPIRALRASSSGRLVSLLFHRLHKEMKESLTSCFQVSSYFVP